MSNLLIEIERENWHKLRDLYANHKKYPSCFYLLQNFINWTIKKPDENVKILSLLHWETTGIFILIHSAVFEILYCNTLEDNLENLVKALNCLDPNVPYNFSAFQERIKPAVEEHFKFCGQRLEDRLTPTVWHHLPKKEAIKFHTDPPEGLILKPLQMENAEQVNRIWPHREPGSVKYVERLIFFNQSVGIFNVDGELLAWCLMLPLGSLGLLQVEEQHKRKGLGSLVVRYMSKLLAEAGIDTMAPVVTTNIPSRTMFESLGFKGVDNANWALKLKN